MTFRLTSATVTLRVTWSSPAIEIRLTIRLFAALSVGIVDADAAAIGAAGGLGILSGRGFAATDEQFGEAGGVLGVLRRPDVARQHDVVVDELDGDVRSRHKTLEMRLETGNIAFDNQVEAGNLLAIGAEDKDVRLAEPCLPKR